MKILQLNHVTLHVEDLEASRAFYRGVLRLEELPRPAFPSAGAWFRLTEAQQLHLIAGRNEPVHSDVRGNHFAVEVDDIAAYKNCLAENEIEIIRRLTRDNGTEQVFFRDPDGHVIEFYSEARTGAA